MGDPGAFVTWQVWSNLASAAGRGLQAWTAGRGSCAIAEAHTCARTHTHMHTHARAPHFRTCVRATPQPARRLHRRRRFGIPPSGGAGRAAAINESRAPAQATRLQIYTPRKKGTQVRWCCGARAACPLCSRPVCSGGAARAKSAVKLGVPACRVRAEAIRPPTSWRSARRGRPRAGCSPTRCRTRHPPGWMEGGGTRGAWVSALSEI